MYTASKSAYIHSFSSINFRIYFSMRALRTQQIHAKPGATTHILVFFVIFVLISRPVVSNANLPFQTELSGIYECGSLIRFLNHENKYEYVRLSLVPPYTSRLVEI